MEIGTIVKIIVISLIYGIVIEFLQEECTTTRHADVFDVLANFAGAIMALGIFILMKIRNISIN